MSELKISIHELIIGAYVQDTNGNPCEVVGIIPDLVALRPLEGPATNMFFEHNIHLLSPIPFTQAWAKRLNLEVYLVDKPYKLDGKKYAAKTYYRLPRLENMEVVAYDDESKLEKAPNYLYDAEGYREVLIRGVHHIQLAAMMYSGYKLTANPV